MKPSIVLLTLSALLFAFAQPVYAASGWTLPDYGDTLDRWIQNQIDMLMGDEQSLELEGSTELLPVSGTGTVTVENQGPESPFVQFSVDGKIVTLTDVPVTSWFGPFVRDAADRGIVSGYRNERGEFTGLYGPGNNVTLEELAKMAFIAAGLSRGECPVLPKNPLAQNRWSTPYIACAENEGFAVFADGTVDILRPATRSEVTITVLQAFGAELRDTAPVGTKLKDVTDSTLFSSAIYAAIQDRVVSGDTDSAGNPTGMFRPADPINRAEVAKILSAAIQVYGGGESW